MPDNVEASEQDQRPHLPTSTRNEVHTKHHHQPLGHSPYTVAGQACYAKKPPEKQHQGTQIIDTHFRGAAKDLLNTPSDATSYGLKVVFQGAIKMSVRA
jgi:hypothetical protein